MALLIEVAALQGRDLGRRRVDSGIAEPAVDMPRFLPVEDVHALFGGFKYETRGGHQGYLVGGIEVLDGGVSHRQTR